MTGTGTTHTEGADIIYDYEGDGPILLTITGAGGAAATYAALAPILADEYTVVRYDRRGNSRSSAAAAELDMAQAARDAAAVIRAMGGEKALIFANSGGANISLKLAADIPEVIAGLIAHEPPALALLPDAAEWLDFVQQVHQLYLAQGVGPAMGLFASSLVGLVPPSTGPGASRGPGFGPNMDHFMARELIPISTFVPDLAAIARNKVHIVTVAGRLSAEAYYARAARLIAERLGCPYFEVPGNHLAFLNDPVPFAAAIRNILHTLAV